MARKKREFSSPEEFQQYVVGMFEMQFKLLARVESIATQGAEAALTARNCMCYGAMILLNQGIIRISDDNTGFVFADAITKEEEAVLKKVFGLTD